MKVKTTQKSIKENCNDVLKIGYGDLQELLKYKSPFAYTVTPSKNCWACDYYVFEVNNKNIVISTGQIPIGRDIDYNLVKEFEKKAQAINLDYNLNYEISKKLVTNLLIEFLNLV